MTIESPEITNYNPFRPFADELHLPSNARDISRRKIGPRLYHYPDTNQILKIGYAVTKHEADAMRLLASKTSVPVASVDSCAEKGESGYILMSFLEGKLLGDVWPTISENIRRDIAQQLRCFVQEWRELREDFYGAVGRGPCQDIFFKHSAMDNTRAVYGPYHSRAEYNEGLENALRASRPKGVWEPEDENLVQAIKNLQDSSVIFTHGDLHLDNILVDSDFRISGVMDWGSSGYSISEREYYEAKSRATDPAWSAAIDTIFERDDSGLNSYSTLAKLDRELVAYSGF